MDAQRDLVARIIKMFSTGDTSAAASVFATEYLDHQGLDEPVKGPGGFEQVVAAARRPYEDLTVNIVDVVAEGEKIAVRLRWNGRHGGTIVVRETIDLLRLENGKVVEHWGSRLWSSEESERSPPSTRAM
jgi:predicted SnoaL-like aldol condensation-catalyzing enzyme